MTRDLIDLVTESETRIAVLEELETLIQSGHVDNVSISEFCALFFLVPLLIYARKKIRPHHRWIVFIRSVYIRT